MRRVPFLINDIIILLPVGDGMVTVPNSVIKNGNTSSPATRELPLKGKPKERNGASTSRLCRVQTVGADSISARM